ncbi:uncharacterized protein LOC126974959 [Leptidea sinapis]|uniref:uncharacterized protein LOC126974959 n=1 Tax=Leptidea sinapis TaxID=189913 RepID=UPI00213DAF6B|nr:uncharacterized protein LOC126974959 [Leptidea sinapis]
MIKIVILCIFVLFVFVSDANVRVKRGKYSNSPQRFYNQPPPVYRTRGPFNENSHYSRPPRPYKVSSYEGIPYDDYRGSENAYRPSSRNKYPEMMNEEYPASKDSSRNEEITDEDLSNIVRNLSKKDLDKIFEMASQGENKNFEEYHPNYSEIIPQEFEEIKPFISNAHNFEFKEAINYLPGHISGGDENNLLHNDIQNTFVDTDESNQYSFIDSFIQQDLGQSEHNSNNNMYSEDSITPQNNQGVIYSDNSQEEILPKPDNLREDFVGAHTKIVPSILRAESMYQLENIANLPLMNYENSKLESVNSYRVPHYTVTSSTRNQLNQNQRAQTFHKAPAVHLSPPTTSATSQQAAASQQSDAHLKAVKIWTHQSIGTAYTLHDDGTLSLERPERPNTQYG